MAYSPIVNYAAKDALAHLDSAKLIKGTELSAEFVAIAADLALKASAADLDTAEATLAAVLSGTYTPTFTATGNIDSATAPGAWMYTRVGAIVTVFGQVSVNHTAGSGATTTLGISLPVASNLANSHELAGHISSPAELSADSSAVTADAANNRATAVWFSQTTSTLVMTVSFMYRII